MLKGEHGDSVGPRKNNVEIAGVYCTILHAFDFCYEMLARTTGSCIPCLSVNPCRKPEYDFVIEAGVHKQAIETSVVAIDTREKTDVGIS